MSDKIRTKCKLGYKVNGRMSTRFDRADYMYNYQGYSFEYPEAYDEIYLLLNKHRNRRYHHKYFDNEGNELTKRHQVPTSNWSDPVYEVIKDRKQDLFLIAHYQVFMCSDIIHMYKDMGRNGEGYIGPAEGWPYKLQFLEQQFLESVLEKN